MTRINLLPWRAERNQRRRKYFLVFLAGAATVALAAVWLADQVIDRAIDRQLARNSQLKVGVTGLDSRIKAIDELHEQRQQLMERMKVVQGLQDDRSAGVQLLDQLARAMPDGVQLREVSVDGGSVSISGTAESNRDIAQLMRGLEATGDLQAPRLQRVSGAQGGDDNSFQLTVRHGHSDEVRP
ncbi:PilN domain-containing protein [Pseudomonas yamanorum]|jgi:type IV pilus assembly protein PilN|uniref:PilN domain-containing protein n=1 Tax=Pseudomonas yamanorum TaxID=515393 RepID=A0ABU1CLP7_9PSED|nr:MULTISPECIES: PilN domain-containing protein [Pseudomonas]AMW86308.1 Type IV pilus biogenesis protein PilN [Pseudomonas yamanorum]MBK5412891.1 PilN domain-containing protein [Pseudomonas sp. TH34]MDR0188191.1 PilN domain-containing protein [Pseudomonas yamanorum]NVZ89883.1 PilN domain-containing protein [Pseudomonas yamanorum]WVN17603.1 PilN domain-containing protein [Pseudomonas yamanorum]